MGCGPLLALRQAMEAAVKDLTGEDSFISVSELPIFHLTLYIKNN
jgi:hypothetical protein